MTCTRSGGLRPRLSTVDVDRLAAKLCITARWVFFINGLARLDGFVITPRPDWRRTGGAAGRKPGEGACRCGDGAGLVPRLPGNDGSTADGPIRPTGRGGMDPAGLGERSCMTDGWRVTCAGASACRLHPQGIDLMAPTHRLAGFAVVAFGVVLLASAAWGGDAIHGDSQYRLQQPRL